MKIITEHKRRILPVLLASVGIPLIICFEAPFEIYGNNLEEFLFSLSDFFPFCILFGVLTALVLAAILFFLPQKVYRFVYPVLVVTAFMLFLQGIYLNLGLGSLPGDNIGVQKASAGAVAVNTLIWVLAEGAAIACAFIKKKDIVSLVCILLSVVVLGTQIVNTIFVALSNDNIAVPRLERISSSDTEKIQRVMTNKGLTTLGSSRNVIVFLIDRFDELYAEKAYAETPQVYDELTGFTWFQDNIAMFGHTYPSVAWMLTNHTYSCESDRVSYLNEAFRGDTPLKRLNDSGYRINLYTAPYYAFTNEIYLPKYIDNLEIDENPMPVPADKKAELAWNMIQMAFYRCLPFVMKGVVGNISSAANALITLESSENAYSLDLKNTYNAVTANDFTFAGDKMFSFIHVEGCHSVAYNEKWEQPTGKETSDYAIPVRTSFMIINRCLQEMKRLGVYEDATIIITGDHGNPVSDSRKLEGARRTALFVKPSGNEDSPLRLSRAQVSHEELWGTIFRSEKIDVGSEYGCSVFDVSENEERVRRYRWHTYMSGSLDEYIYEIKGDSSQFRNWSETGHKHYDKFLMD